MSSSQPYAHQNSGNLREDGNYTAAGKGQVCIPTADKNLQFRKIKAVTANQVCFDCPGPRPTWASVTYGTIVVAEYWSTHFVVDTRTAAPTHFLLFYQLLSLHVNPH